MSDAIVKIRGTRSGLQLSFAKDADYEAIEKEILQRFESGSSFFVTGTEVFVSKDSLPHEQIEKLKRLFHRRGMRFRTEKHAAAHAKGREQQQDQRQPAKEAAKEPKPGKDTSAEPQVQQMVVIDKTLRGGQEIQTESSVLVCGNVNPGAQIIAGGSIDIRGTCRGMVHAGAYGNSKAFIIADHLMPTQIRIANLIARSPDVMEKTDKAERASIKDGRIVIEPIER